MNLFANLVELKNAKNGDLTRNLFGHSWQRCKQISASNASRKFTQVIRGFI